MSASGRRCADLGRFAAAVDEAGRFKRSRTAGAYFGLVPTPTPVGRARLDRPEGAEFYIAQHQASRTALNQSYLVYDGQRVVSVASLNSGVPYYVVVDAVNEKVITLATGRPVELIAACSKP